MIRIYPTGAEFLEENEAYLKTSPYLNSFFFLDAPLVTCADTENYALRAGEGGDVLLAVKAGSFPTLLFGSEKPVAELFSHLLDGGYALGSLLGAEETCDAAAAFLQERYGIEYEEALAMDFMEAREITAPSCAQVETPTVDDLPEILECRESFIADCGLLDELDEDSTRRSLPRFRVLREGGRIVSMAAASAPSAAGDRRISDVYTRPDCRGRGYAGMVVNTLKNEILTEGCLATLNVDKKNPISNRLYASLGFVRLFSQGEYRRRP